MLQRQIILKQLQEMQQQQQLRELGGVRQQNNINQLAYLNKQTSGGLHHSLVDGVPVHETSQKFMVGNTHLTQRGTSPIIQGFPNGLVFSQAQGQAMPMGMLPQQPEVSLYGTPIANSGNNLNQYSHLQGASHDFANMFARGNNNQMDIPVMQPVGVGNSSVNEQYNTSQEKVCMSGGTFSPKNVFQDKNMFGQVLMPASDDGVPPFNFQPGHSFQKSASMKASGMTQEQNCWPVVSPRRTPKVDSPRGTSSLDPLEEKILFNTDDGSWESALGGQGTMAAGGFASGRWSALMQTAVAETSSSDIGQQEEWSGLTFQNPHLSADNQPANYIGDGKPKNSWVDNNLQRVSSPTSKPENLFQNSNPSFSFPGFQQYESSHESIQHSPGNARKWSGSNSQQKQHIEELFQTPSPLQRVWHDQHFEHSENDRHQPNISSYTNDSQSCHNIAGQSLKENVWLHPNGGQPVVGGSQKPSDQAVHRLSNQDRGHAGKVNFGDNVSNIMMNSGKANTQKNSGPSEEMLPRNTADTIASLFDSSSAFNTNDNMFDFDILNKTGKSEEQRTGTPSGSRDSIPASPVSQMETSGDQQYYKNSFALQGSGSGLDHLPQEVNYNNMFTSGPLNMGNHLQNQHQRVASLASQSSNTAFPGITSKFQASVAATSRDAPNMFQSSIRDQVFPTLDTMQVTQPSLMSGVPPHMGHSMGLPSMSPNIPSQLHGLQSEVSQVFSGSFPSPDSTHSNVENQQHRQNSFPIRNNNKEMNMFAAKETLATQLNPPSASLSASPNRAIHGQESVGRHLLEANSFNSASLLATHHQALDRAQQRDNSTPKISERDLVAFSHALRPSHGQQQDFSLLQQVQYQKNLEAVRNNNTPMKSSEDDSGLNLQHGNANPRQLELYRQKLGVENLLREQSTKSQPNSFSSGDNELLRCSSEAVGNQLVRDSAKSFIQDNRGMLLSSHGDAHSHSKEQSHANLQMAPSWFKHYGTWKNGQMLPMNDASVLKDAGRQFSMGRSFEHFGQAYNANANEQTLSSIAADQVVPKQLAPSFVSPSEIGEQNLAVLRPKKRKLLPWHKEVTQGLQQASHLAGIEWASTSNRLCEKVKDDAEIYDDMLPVPGAKRRLVLTTELMQQVFRSPPAVILSGDAYSNSESMIYFVCRLALGDACSSTNGSPMAILENDKSSEKLKSDKVGEEDLSRTAENLIARTKRVESYLLRLDKTPSMLDLRLECQELEKFSVVTRFAKFHNRIHTSSSSSGSAPSAASIFAQRYVVGFPNPKVVPEGTNCLSL